MTTKSYVGVSLTFASRWVVVLVIHPRFRRVKGWKRVTRPYKKY